MGKRAAPKPKAESKASAKKKAKTHGPVTPIPAAPGSWGRPELPELRPEADALRMFLVDIEDGPISAESLAHELRLYGVTDAGVSVCARLQGVRPYFFARCPATVHGRLEEVRLALEAACSTQARPGLNGGQGAVLKVELVRRTPVLIFQPEDDLLRITVAGPRLITPCVKALEQGIRLPAAEGRDALDFQTGATFESNVSLVLRFLVDNDLGGGRWIEFPAGAYKPSAEPRVTTAQLEIDVSVNADKPDASVQAISLDSEIGSAVPPVRTIALETFTDANQQLTAVSCVMMVHGDSCPRVRAIWLRRDAGPVAVQAQSANEDAQWSDVVVEEFDPNKMQPPTVFTSEDEETIVEHLGKTLDLLDADILLTHDLSHTVRGLLGKKGVTKSGSALARGLCRRVANEIKMTAKSNEVSGMAGRLGFDLQKQIEKDHRLTDYSLGNLSEHFCQEPLPELREATLAQLLVSRPRAFAHYVLRQAEATLRIFEKLAFLFNFVEMARVTGCPLAYLLERGQAVKVQAQLLSEARARGFVLPSQRPSGGEETTFEGATVLEPVCGFHRAPVAVLDFASLYPSIMMAHNLCYSTLMPPGRERQADPPAHHVAPPTAGTKESGVDTCFVDAGVRKGLLPSILERLIAARKDTKKRLAKCGSGEEMSRKILNGRQLALKLSANSVYGFTGAVNGPLPCLELAGAVTAYGREMIQTTKQKVESHFVKANGYKSDAEVVYGDTDSVMVRFGGDDLPMEEVMRLSNEAADVCSALFPPPVHLEFEKVYRPFLLMAKKRYAGLAWTSLDGDTSVETKGIETVRRDWSDLVRQGLEQTLQLLLRRDGSDGAPAAIAYVRGIMDELRQNRMDLRSLVISKSLGRDEYATKAPHVEVAEKMRKRDPATAPRLGDRVPYLVLAGAAKTKVYERAEDPLYALEHDLPVDADYYLENQLKQPLVRVFELVCGSAQKAEQALFAAGSEQKVVKTMSSTMGGMGKFMKARPKCLDCQAANASGDQEPFCAACAAKGPERAQEVLDAQLVKARRLRGELSELRSQCARRCAVTSDESLAALPADVVAAGEAAAGAKESQRETCSNVNCQSIFRRARTSKELKAASDALLRLKVTDW